MDWLQEIMVNRKGFYYHTSHKSSYQHTNYHHHHHHHHTGEGWEGTQLGRQITSHDVYIN